MSKRTKERVFRMKRFEVRHSRSANKVGVDGVLIGAWATAPAGVARILDAGSGCGLIALMMAQRAESAMVEGIELDPEAVEESTENAAASPWSDRIRIICGDFSSLADEARDDAERRYDLVVSNPPFFHAGVEAPESARMLARHADTLSPETLILRARDLLRVGGRLAFICQAESEGMLRDLGAKEGLRLMRMTRVKGNPGAQPKRLLMEWQYGEDDSRTTGVEADGPEEAELTIEFAPGDYTPAYVALCRDFYLYIDRDSRTNPVKPF